MAESEDVELDPLPSQIAAEVARILREDGILVSAPPDRQEWVDPPEAAKILGYSISRFYHIYDHLGLVPSRTSRRKMRFRRRDVDGLVILSQSRKAGRPSKTRNMVPITRKISGTKMGLNRIYIEGK